MKIFFRIIMLFGFVCIMSHLVQGQIMVEKKDDGFLLKINGQRVMINGMNWDYIPIGYHAVNADFWSKSEDVIKAGLDAEMKLLKEMYVNAIRHYTGIPSKWIKYIYEEHGIYTMLNHPFGRYGIMLDGNWEPLTDYADPKVQEVLLQEVKDLVIEYQDTPGLLLYLLGNENNYGLFWEGSETEDIPVDDTQKAKIGELRARPMYKLMNNACQLIKTLDTDHPVAICNGDLVFIDIIAEECSDVDIYGTNAYRGASFGDMFELVQEKLDKPILFTEFGADAYNTLTKAEDQLAQASYMVANWKEIYQQAASKGRVGNSIGGFTFQFSDGWWKYGFDFRINEHIHDDNASWENGGYQNDFIKGQNNMNEEWFGICAKGPTNEHGLYTLYPRAAYYALQKVHELDVYDPNTTTEIIEQHCDEVMNSIEEQINKSRYYPLSSIQFQWILMLSCLDGL